MAVFDPRQGQVLVSPVSNYYQGEANRRALADAEQEAELRGLEIEAAKRGPSADEKEKADLELQELRLNVEKKREELGDAEMQRRANAYGPILDKATEMSQAGDKDSLDKAIEFANKELRLAAEGLGGDVLAEFIEGLGEDRALDKEEISRIKFGIQAYWESVGTETGTPSELQKTLAPLLESGAITQDEHDALLKARAEKLALQTPTKPTVRDSKLAALKTLGTSDEDAIDLVDGYVTVTSSTDSMGNVTVTNTRTKKSYKISAREAIAANLSIPTEGEDVVQEDGYTGPAWAKPVALITPAPNLTNQNISESQGKLKEIDKALQAAALVTAGDMMDAAGVANIAQRGMNNVLQLISLNMLPRIFQEETDARLKVMFFNQAVRSAVVISSKGNVWEQQMVEKMLPKPDNILADPIGEGIAFSRTIHYLTNQREADVAFIEGRAATQIPRKALGIEDDPIVVTSEEDAESYPSGTWVILNGRLGMVP